MATKARFLKAVDNTRPRKSHRYFPFGPKIERELTLFDLVSLEAWVALEAESSVVSYCERPLIIPNSSPKRVVDFWVRFADREEVWLLERDKNLSEVHDPAQLMPAFSAWAAANDMVVRFVARAPHEKRIYLDNWGRMLRELSANRRFVSRALLEQVSARLAAPISLSELIRLFPAEDPVLVRTTLYALLHDGRARCTNIEQQSVGAMSIVEGL